MIINTEKLREFERSEIARKDISYKDALAIFDDLRREAISLGVLNCENIIDGLDIDIRIAKAVNGLR